jgi:hypothetical protein
VSKRTERQRTGWHAQYKQASRVDFLIDSAARFVRRKAEKAAVSRSSQVDAKSGESGAESTAEIETGAASSARSGGWSGAMAGDHGGVARKGRERVRTVQGGSRLSKTDDRHNRHCNIKTLANSYYGLAVL